LPVSVLYRFMPCVPWARQILGCAVLALLPVLVTPALAQHRSTFVENMPDFSFQPLPGGRSGSGSGGGASAPRTPGAHVITREQIEASGATSIPEVLRLAPGIQVTQLGPVNWNVGLRGPNNTVTGGLLVLLDGRSLYNPLFGGIFWRQYDLVVDDIERVEVIRTPGGTLWGGHAVRAVVNIVTRGAGATAGTGLSAGASGPDRGAGTLRHGATLGDNAWYSVYGKYGVVTVPGVVGQPGVHQWLVGGRLDWALSSSDTLMLQAGFLEGRDHRPVPAASDVEDGNLLARWQHRGAGGDSTLQAYIDETRTEDAAGMRAARTLDIDFQHSRPFGESARLGWGGGYRRVEYGSLLAEAPDAVERSNAFLQGDFTLGRGFGLSLGSRFESGTLGGFEYLPSARLLWQPGGAHTLWALAFQDSHLPASAEAQGGPVIVAPVGPAARLEQQAGERSGWEIGYRGTPAGTLTFDVAVGQTRFEGLDDTRAGVLPAGTPDPLTGDALSLEGSVEWRLSEALRMTTSYSLFNASVDGLLPEGTGEFTQRELEWRTWFTTGGPLQMNAALLWVDGDRAALAGDHVRLDLGLGWNASPSLQVGLNVLNLLDDPGAGPGSTINTLLPPPDSRRAVLGELRTAW